ncbi:MAG: phosphoribosylformylglycinamidine synthase subunit PurS, partial [Candidatus Omnitrophica bacterium]|nr:phosphoribosylformylglycinamidine synthase subunit PurS [Candidatus Omnitrophota bacterium]MBU1932734.1 phosphoribosylformylglycinamidine synthase subunit PurS [Candidatus Omnitrophota bacterium]
MKWKIEIKNKRGVFDPLASGVKKDIRDLGIDGVKKVGQSQVFIISGDIRDKDAHKIARKLLADPITQEYVVGSWLRVQGSGQRVVEIAYNPGVMDPVEESAKKAIRDLGITGVKSIKTERKYFIDGNIKKTEFKAICEKLLYNKVIQHIVKTQGSRGGQVKCGAQEDYKFKLITVDILKADDKKLMKISRDGQLFLNLREM